MSDAKVTDEERLLQIKKAHASRRPSDANPAWKNSHSDLGFVLGYLDALRANVIEECAKVCDDWSAARMPEHGGNALRNCAVAIRAMKEKP